MKDFWILVIMAILALNSVDLGFSYIPEDGGSILKQPELGKMILNTWLHLHLLIPGYILQLDFKMVISRYIEMVFRLTPEMIILVLLTGVASPAI